jgi:hypothetical protein
LFLNYLIKFNLILIFLIVEYRMSKEAAYSHYLLEVKQEYTKQLSNLLVPVIYEGLISIYTEAKKTNKDSPMKMFQILLARIPNWNQNIINGEYQRIVQKTQCDWINDLITAVFISHAKILSSIKTKKKSKTLNLKIPNGDYFIHKAYIECARQFWKNPYLFYDDVTMVNTIDYQRNMREVELIIEQAIQESVRKLLPVKNILQQYIALDDSSSSSSSSSDEEEKPAKKEKNKNKEEEAAKYNEEYITNNMPEKDKKKLEKSVKREVSRVVKEGVTDEDNFSNISVSHDITNKKKKKIEPEAPIVEAAIMESPITETPITEAPIAEAPIAEAPIVEAAIMESPIIEAPITEAPISEAPIAEASPFEMPLFDAPLFDAPLFDAPNMETYPKNIDLFSNGPTLLEEEINYNLLDKSNSHDINVAKDFETDKKSNNLPNVNISNEDIENLSMNSKLDRTYDPVQREELKSQSSRKQVQINIDEIPKLNPVDQNNDIKTVVINTKAPELEPNNNKPVVSKSNIAQKRDIKRNNYSFF